MRRATVQRATGATAWRPEQNAHRLKVDFPEDESMRISHEAKLVTCLRTGGALREPRARSRN